MRGTVGWTEAGSTGNTLDLEYISASIANLKRPPGPWLVQAASLLVLDNFQGLQIRVSAIIARNFVNNGKMRALQVAIF